MDQALIWTLDIAMKYQTRQDADMLRNLCTVLKMNVLTFMKTSSWCICESLELKGMEKITPLSLRESYDSHVRTCTLHSESEVFSQYKLIPALKINIILLMDPNMDGLHTKNIFEPIIW